VGALTESAYRSDGFLSHDSDYAQSLRDARRRAVEAELVVAVAGGELLGSVTFCPAGSPWREIAGDGEAEFRMLAVGQDSRRRGAARALVQHCIARSRELDLHALVICSDVRMHKAQRLYAELGFQRLPARDWSPLPGIDLRAFALTL